VFVDGSGTDGGSGLSRKAGVIGGSGLKGGIG